VESLPAFSRNTEYCPTFYHITDPIYTLLPNICHSFSKGRLAYSHTYIYRSYRDTEAFKMCFGIRQSEKDVEAANKNREIEKVIRADQKRAAREVKLLLLGTPQLWIIQPLNLHEELNGNR
jgi:hypothetical protein